MTDRLGALLAENPSLERASRLAPRTLPVLSAFESLLPDAGLRPGTTTSITGVGAISLALSLVARATKDSWTASIGMPALGLRAADELGIDLDRFVVVDDPGKQWIDVLAALVDAFDVVLAHPPPTRHARKVSARVREQDAVLVVIGQWVESDVRIAGGTSQWHGIGRGYGHLEARTIDVTVSGRRAATRPRDATLWLPDPDGNVSLVERDNVVRLAR
jgi:hypothetical protein